HGKPCNCPASNNRPRQFRSVRGRQMIRGKSCGNHSERHNQLANCVVPSWAVLQIAMRAVSQAQESKGTPVLSSRTPALAADKPFIEILFLQDGLTHPLEWVENRCNESSAHMRNAKCTLVS